MRHSRILLVTALALVVAHVVVIATLGNRPPGPILSDIIQLLLGAFATLASFQAAKRSSTFGRVFWKLAAWAFVVWCVGQIIGGYYGSIVNRDTQLIWYVQLFYSAWPAPLAMCIFLDVREEKEGFDWERILDFGQVAIVFILVYFYFSNLPTHGAQVGAWRLSITTDGLLATGFFLRSIVERKNPTHRLFWSFGCYRLVALLTDLYFVAGFPEPINGAWFDLVWSMPWLIPIVTATQWSGEKAAEAGTASGMLRRRLQITQFLPLIFPLLIILMAAEVARGQVVVAGIAVLLSLGTSYGRLILTSREQQRSADALAESEERFRTVFDGSPVGMAVIGMNGKVVASNTACRVMLGLGPDEELTTEIFDGLTHPDNREQDAARYQSLAKGEIGQIRQEKRYILKDGRTAWADLHLYLLRGRKGEPRYIIGMAVDISEQKTLESQLRQAQRMETIGRLAGGVAHDFNNLLTVIKGYCDLVLEKTQKEVTIQSHMEHIDRATDQAASLTRQLLAFSRQQVLQPKVFDLNVLVLNAKKMLQRLIGEDIEVITITSPNLGSVKADPGQIEQVILNLVVNARDAMPDGGKLTLKTANAELDEAFVHAHWGARTGRFVLLTVTDTGIGMSEEVLAHIFEPFFTTKELGKGTGLGLSMVYGIVKQSGGSIWVNSKPGEGASFTIYLPRVEEPPEDMTRATRPSEMVRGSETILLVEDDAPVRELTCDILQAQGYEVLVANGPNQALDLCNRYNKQIHLVLTDLVMPGMNGAEMADLVVKLRPGIQVLFMSGYSDNALLQNGAQDKKLNFLQKPFTASVLHKMVREILDGRVK
ncbi:MAG TPA: ATP-binding protein [Candidatus Dormibacteraeota bacterium]|nr:ATP-binding protein [Candidatus Dormibacteraeota bacterium]